MRNRKKNLRLISTSDIYTKRLKNRTTLAGGVTVDRSVAIDRIRNSSIGLSQNILKPTESNCSFVYNPSSYGEGKNYSVYPNLNNLFSFSEDFSQSVWIKATCAVASSSEVSPINSTLVQKVTSTGVAGYIYRNYDFVIGQQYTSSIYVKAINQTTVTMHSFQQFGSVNFDLSTGTSNTVQGICSNPTITALSNGWFRISATFTASSTGANNFGIVQFAATTGDVFYIYGEQFEKGSTATSYQRTTDAIIDFQFTRATTATVTNKDGSIGDSCYNLFQRSEEFDNAAWTKSNSTVTANQIPNPINGNIDADLVTANTNNAFVSQNLVVNTGSTYSFSAYLKNNNATTSIMRATNTNSIVITINWSGSVLTSVTQTLGLNADFFDVGNGWYRVIGTYIAQSSSLTHRIDPNPSTSGNSIYVWGAQVVQGLPLDYLKTTNRLAVPRADYTLDLTKPSLLIEPQRTNIVFPSATGSTQTRTVTAQVYTMSFRGTGSVVLSGVATGTLNGTGANNKVYLTFTPTAGSLTFTVTGTITDFQVEAGNNATTIIPTTTATVTRNSETSFVDLWNNNLLNQNNFTLFVDGYLYDGSGATRSIALADTTTGGTNDVGFFDGIKASFAASSTITSDTVALSSNTAFKIAIQRSGTSVKFFRNGAQIWSTQTVAVVDYRYLIINNGGSTFAINKVEIYKETLSDAVLITKTT